MRLFTKSAWKKVVVYLFGIADDHDLHQIGWEMTDRLWLKTGAPMFFAYYSQPNGETRIEIKVELDWTLEQFEKFFMPEAASQPVRITVEPFNESPAHAQAYVLSRLLRGKGEALTKDVLHWALNMTGYSYAQEIKLLAEHTAHIADNLEKL